MGPCHAKQILMQSAHLHAIFFINKRGHHLTPTSWIATDLHI